MPFRDVSRFWWTFEILTISMYMNIWFEKIFNKIQVFQVLFMISRFRTRLIRRKQFIKRKSIVRAIHLMCNSSWNEFSQVQFIGDKKIVPLTCFLLYIHLFYWGIYIWMHIEVLCAFFLNKSSGFTVNIRCFGVHQSWLATFFSYVVC